MADDQQQSGQPPAGGPGSSSPQDAAPQQQPPEWGQAPQTPGYQPPGGYDGFALGIGLGALVGVLGGGHGRGGDVQPRLSAGRGPRSNN